MSLEKDYFDSVILILAVVMVVFVAAMLKSSVERIRKQNMHMPITFSANP